MLYFRPEAVVIICSSGNRLIYIYCILTADPVIGGVLCFHHSVPAPEEIVMFAKRSADIGRIIPGTVCIVPFPVYGKHVPLMIYFITYHNLPFYACFLQKVFIGQGIAFTDRASLYDDSVGITLLQTVIIITMCNYPFMEIKRLLQIAPAVVYPRYYLTCLPVKIIRCRFGIFSSVLGCDGINISSITISELSLHIKQFRMRVYHRPVYILHVLKLYPVAADRYAGLSVFQSFIDRLFGSLKIPRSYRIARFIDYCVRLLISCRLR